MPEKVNEQEREELHRAIWAIADDLRGSVDGWDFKSYILGTMFYRFLSEHLTSWLNTGEAAAGNKDFDYAALSDEEAALPEEEIEDIVNSVGFYIRPSELFCNVRARAASDENLNMTLEHVFRHIVDSAQKFHIIIMTQANSQVNSSVLELLPKFKMKKESLVYCLEQLLQK